MRNEVYEYINNIRRRIVPDAREKHYGSYMSFDDKAISPGCMACKTGSWLCVFVGTKCNATCPHCPNPNVNGKKDIMEASGFGEADFDRIEEILGSGLFTGVGISGGEPLLYLDKTVELTRRIKRSFPQLYVWNYTNGILATEKNLERLAKAGIDEIRFDLAAERYSERTLANMERATKIIPSVGIEVPVLTDMQDDLLRAVDLADAAGVKYINLHDLYVNDAMYKNGAGAYIRSYDPVSGVQRDIVHSAPLIYGVVRHIKDNSLNIVPNDCTLINMQLQHIGVKYLEARYKGSLYMDFEQYMIAVLTLMDKEKLLVTGDKK